MEGLKYIETLKLTIKKAIADKNETNITSKTAYFNSKAKTVINKNEMDENIQTTNQQILNGISVWISKGSGWTIESVDDQHLNIVKYKSLKGSPYIWDAV